MSNTYYDFLNDQLISIFYTFKFFLIHLTNSETLAPAVSAELPLTSRGLARGCNPLICSTLTVGFYKEIILDSLVEAFKVTLRN